MAVNDLKLRQFVRVCECGNMTKAAEQLYVTQSALSQSVTSLEKEIGCPLFDRKGRSLELNRQGKIVLRYAREIIALTDEMNREVRDSLTSLRHLGIAAVDTSLAAYLTAYFMLDHPDYTVSTDKFTRVSPEMLTEGEKDLCLSAAPLKGDGVKSVRIFRDFQYVVVPPSSPHYGQKEARLADFADEDFIRSSMVRRQDTMEYESSVLLSERIAQEKMERRVQYVARPALRLMLVQNSITKNSFVSALGMLLNEDFRSIDRKRCVRLTDEGLGGEYWLSYDSGNRKVQPFTAWLFSRGGAGKYLLRDGMSEDDVRELIRAGESGSDAER